jgi:GTP-binding protein Era
MTKTKCGFTAIIGTPNSGKSTLINQIVGSKISIATDKIQTTRTIIRGILMKDDAQIIFIDTPGIFAPTQSLEKAIVSKAWEGLSEADNAILVVDSTRPSYGKNLQIVKKLQEDNKKAILVINKIDLVKPSELLAIADRLYKTDAFSDVFMISALKNDGVDDMVKCIIDKTPDGPYLYPEDEVSDLPIRFFAAEITREKLFNHLDKELPYSLSVDTELWQEEEKNVTINQVIYVLKETQKKIIIGKKGALIKQIGIEAREELNHILGKRVSLFLFVKVKEDWLKKPYMYEHMGLKFEK